MTGSWTDPGCSPSWRIPRRSGCRCRRRGRASQPRHGMTEMRYRPLGRSGLIVSVVGVGCNNFGGRIDLERSRAVVQAALDAGVTLFDTADTYGNKGGSETVLGELLADRRDEVVLATKFGMDMRGANGEDH